MTEPERMLMQDLASTVCYGEYTVLMASCPIRTYKQFVTAIVMLMSEVASAKLCTPQSVCQTVLELTVPPPSPRPCNVTYPPPAMGIASATPWH